MDDGIAAHNELAAKLADTPAPDGTVPRRPEAVRQEVAAVVRTAPAVDPTTQMLFHDQAKETDGDRTRQREGWPASGRKPPRSHSAAYKEDAAPAAEATAELKEAA